jgi:hypothetical protein
MKILVIADIHSNLTAFNAVLEDAGKRVELDEIWNLGDVVGYGPDPHECIQLLKRICKVCVAGNHDLAVAGNLESSRFNEGIAEILEWTRQQLSFEDKEFLEGLPILLRKVNLLWSMGHLSILFGNTYHQLRSQEKACHILKLFIAWWGTSICRWYLNSDKIKQAQKDYWRIITALH